MLDYQKHPGTKSHLIWFYLVLSWVSSILNF